MLESGPRRLPDANATIAGYLRDLAYAQASPPQMYGYKRAAAAVFGLETQLPVLIASEQRVPKIRGIGPASTRIIQEVLDRRLVHRRACDR